jgi:hypothetical protein
MPYDVFDADQAAGHWAIYREPAVAPFDAPLTNPLAHLDKIKIHSALAYLQRHVEIDVTINHAAVAASNGWSWSTFSFNWTPEAYTIDRLLGTHNLGIIPICLVASNQGIVDPGMPIQVNGSGGTRYLDIYLTTTEVRARERVDSGTGALPALNQTYKLIVLREPVPLPDEVFWAEDGRVRGETFDSDYHYLRAVATGESPYRLSAPVQQIDTMGGICRFADALGTVTHDFYDPSRYTGSMVAAPSVEVQR